MYALNIAKAIKKMPVSDSGDFIFEYYYKQIGFSKESNYYSMNRLQKKKRFIVARKQINRKST